MKPFGSLFARILVWFFLSLLVLTTVLLGFFNLQFRLSPDSPLRAESGDRLMTLGRLLVREMRDVGTDGWDAILEQYSEDYQVDLAVFSRDGQWVAGKHLTLPSELQEQIATRRMRGPDLDDGPPTVQGERARARFSLRTTDPTRYWVAVRIPVRRGPGRRNAPLTLVAVSDSITGKGLFMDPRPWLIVVAVVMALSVVMWLPLIRTITRPIGEMTRAAEQIAQGRFDIKVQDGRSDEIGRLGRAINEMAGRLTVLVNGQKRFLGDVAHELASPIGRMQMALGILEQRVDEKNQAYVGDVMEEAQQMSELVNELLSFTRAEINPAKVALTDVYVAPIARRIAEREGTAEFLIRVTIDEDLQIRADPELLARALANLLRNAVRYAGKDGPIDVVAGRLGEQVFLEVRDSGPGVPGEVPARLFEPFYRPERARDRNTGGVGLGLAIVKTCVEACEGVVSAHNLEPHGFCVRMVFCSRNSDTKKDSTR